MSADAPSDGPDSRRALLAVVAVLGLVAASTAAPVLANQTPLGGLDSPSAPDDAPGFLRQFDGLRHLLGGSQPDVPVEGSTGAFGALSLGDATSVGGQISQQQRTEAATPHFVAEADRPRYWRTGAYVEYTGTGWERDDVNSITATRPVDRRNRNWQTVTLRQPATALPAPWRPVDLQFTCTDAESCGQTFSRTDTGGIRARPGLDAGSEYEVQSLEPVTDEQLLRDIRVRGSIASTAYTTVDTTDRVEQLAERVVGDADNRYDAARAVEHYLEREKEYSLSDVPEPGDQIADQFLFEQEKGYCEYYATAMVVMLRSQDIPARYVAGYAPGERVGDDRYLVRGADAHAWVEVYFERLGWVRFDPTPSAPRQAADERLGEGTPSYRVQLNQTAVPGETVTASVTTAGVPASNVVVSVNGERVGTTDVDGEVEFTVPYDETLEVTVQPGANESDGQLPAGGDGNFSAFGAASFAQPDGDEGANGTTQEFDVNANVRFQFDGEVEPGATLPLRVTVGGQPFENAAVSIAGEKQGRTDGDGYISVAVPPDASGVVQLTASRANLTRTTTYPLDDLSVAVSPSMVAPFPTTEASARVTAGGEPVSDAVVTLDGERVGTTDADGRVQFEIPLSRVPAVSASAGGDRAVTYVDGVLPTLAATVLVALSALGAVAVAARRRGVTLNVVVTAVTHLASEAVSAVVEGILGAVDAVEELAAEFRAATEDGWQGVLTWLRSLPGRVSAPDVRGWLAGVAAAVRADLEDGSERAATRGDASGEEASIGRMQAVWRRFVAVVGVERWETKTPGEVARRAVRAGFPRKPVYALTDAFREAAYGDRSAESRLERARDALASLRDDEEGEQ